MKIKNGAHLNLWLFRIVYNGRPWVWGTKVTAVLTFTDGHQEHARVFGPLIVCWRIR